MKKQIVAIVVVLMIVLAFEIAVQAQDNSVIYKNNISKYLEEEMKKVPVPGMTISIVDKDEIVYANTYGEVKNIDTPFILGSMSKSFTALAIIQLVEDGRINLEDKISKYLSEDICSFEVSNQITVRELLNQTSGISYNQIPPDLKVTASYGTFVYANANYNLLGNIVEATTNMSFQDYIQQYIFNPLGMTQSFTSIELAKGQGLIDGYRNYFGIPVSMEMDYPRKRLASGYIISSASDVSKYLMMYLNDGRGKGNVLATEKNIHTMLYDGVDATNDNASGDMFGGEASYGMGWIHKEINNETLFYHSGKVENYVSTMVLLPERELGVVMLFNMQEFLVAQPMIETIQEGVVSILMEEQPVIQNKYHYIRQHLIFNSIYLLILMSACMPIILLKSWCKKIHVQEKCILKGAYTLIIHIIWPTILIVTLPLIGIPLVLIKNYVPDLFIVLLVSSILLYFIGIYKVYFLIKDAQIKAKSRKSLVKENLIRHNK